MTAAAAVAALGAAPPPDVSPVTLAVAGQSNANVSIAARDSLVVAAWGASRSGAADVYAAVSRDGGRSFSAPIRVNATAGEAALGGERAPRVAIAPRQGGPAIAVLWTAKAPAPRTDAPAGTLAPGPVIRLAESTDGGRTFAAPIDLSGPGAAGIRGWAALAGGADGAWYAAWLDGRAEAAKKAAAGTSVAPASGAGGSGAGHHHHGGSTGPGPLQEVYYRVVGRNPQAAEALGATGVCFCCKTAILAPAAAGTGAGSLVLAWRHIFPNSERDIALRTIDAATGRPGMMTRVSDDRWQLQACPDDGPSLAAAATSGTIHVVWPTLADASPAAAAPEKAIYHARTTDGRVFTPRRRLDRSGSGAAHPVVAALASGSAVALWDELADGARRVVAQPIREPAEPLVLGPGTYPAVAALDDAFVVAWTVGSGDAAVVRVQRVAP